MNYVLAAVLSVTGIAILIWNKSLAEKSGAFYSRRFAVTFGKLAYALRWNDPNKPFNMFMYRGFVITTGIILLVFGFAAFSGTNFVGPSAQSANSLLQVQN